MLENIRLSFRGILSHKMRSFLTMLGIIIGIAAIIAIVSTIQGTNDQIKENLIGSGDNSVNVKLMQNGNEYSMGYGSLPSGVPVISTSTLNELRSIDHAENVSLYRQREDWEDAYYLNNNLSGAYIVGVDTSYFDCAGLLIRKGRGITQNDIDSYLRVCVLDEASALALFPNEDPIGKTIELHSLPFTVVGIAANKSTFEPVIETMEDYEKYNSGSSSCSIYIPGSQWPVLYQYDEPQSVMLRADDANNMTSVGKDAAEILNASVTNTSIAYEAEDLLEQAKQIQQLSQSTNTMLIWIAGISLLVGGIGVMNIMLVSVTERTSEIGLKKAIGARKKAILAQFLTEAVVLTSVGGILGVITGGILAEIISMVNDTPVSFSANAALFSVLFSMAIGIIFGLLPSMKAANLDPIEALRRD